MRIIDNYCPACYDFIQALDKCHQAEYYKRAFGLCNNEKEALSKCLHEARLDGVRRYIKKSKEKQEKIHARWKEMEEEEYGEDAILKKIIQRQIDKQNKEQEAKTE